MKSSVLTRYRVMAYVTAILLIVLVFVAMPLEYLTAVGSSAQTLGNEMAQYIGMLHGFLYMVYLLAALDLTLRLRIPKWQMVLVLLAGTIPFCAFIAERKMSNVYRARLEARGRSAEREQAGSS